MTNTIEVKVYTTKELSALYRVTERTFTKWTESFADELGPKIGNYYNLNQVQIIFQRLGTPKPLT